MGKSKKSKVITPSDLITSLKDGESPRMTIRQYQEVVRSLLEENKKLEKRVKDFEAKGRTDEEAATNHR